MTLTAHERRCGGKRALVLHVRSRAAAAAHPASFPGHARPSRVQLDRLCLDVSVVHGYKPANENVSAQQKWLAQMMSETSPQGELLHQGDERDFSAE